MKGLKLDDLDFGMYGVIDMRRKTGDFRWIAVIGIVSILMLLVPRLAKLTVSDLLMYKPDSPVLAGLALLGLYCLKSVTMVAPQMLLFVVAGIAFSPRMAIMLTYAGLVLESTIGFYIGKGLGGKRVRDLINKRKRAKRILESSNSNGILACCMVRLLGPPADPASMFIGTTGVKFWQFLLGSIIGFTPGMIPVVLMGEAATDPASEEFLIPLAIKISIFILTLILYARFSNHKKVIDSGEKKQKESLT